MHGETIKIIDNLWNTHFLDKSTIVQSVEKNFTFNELEFLFPRAHQPALRRSHVSDTPPPQNKTSCLISLVIPLSRAPRSRKTLFPFTLTV